jgi:hypothetical protein
MRMISAVLALTILIHVAISSSAPIAAGAAAIGIGDFRAVPSHAEAELSSLQENVSLRLTLANSGNASGTVNVTILEGSILIASSNVTVGANSTSVVNFTWTVKGAGRHNATAVIVGDAVTSPAYMEAVCTLKYIPMKNPSPWYTIPCAFMAIILPMVAIFLVFRWLGKGGMPKKAAKDRMGEEQQAEATDERQQAEGQNGRKGRRMTAGGKQ